MKSSKPPAIATWLAEHLIPGDKGESLTGDLLEQFSREHSVAWYWREVLVAIVVNFSAELPLRLAAGFTLTWLFFLTVSQPLLRHVFRSNLFHVLWSPSIRLAWPFSGIAIAATVTVLYAVPLIISLCAYWVGHRNFGLRRLERGFLIGMIGYSVGFIIWMVVPVPANGWVSIITGDLAGSMPLFFSLLLAFWAVSLPVKKDGCGQVGY